MRQQPLVSSDGLVTVLRIHTVEFEYTKLRVMTINILQSLPVEVSHFNSEENILF